MRKKSVLDGFLSRRENGAMAAPNTVARDMNVMAERKGHDEDVNIPGKWKSTIEVMLVESFGVQLFSLLQFCCFFHCCC